MGYCKICTTEITPFMSFGKMPLGNGFLKQEEFTSEYFFEMKTAFCESCAMFQLSEQPEPSRMFHDNYAFFSNTSVLQREHFKNYAEMLYNTYLNSRKDPFIIEIGSNDGILLTNFKQLNIKHLGIEPSSNVALAAQTKGINTVAKFFSYDLATKIKDEYGIADLITASNVMCHIANINDVIRGIALLLKDNGILVFEDPYLGDVIQKISFDQIYDEHVFLFSIIAIKNLFSKFGLELFKVEHLKVHGGSMRYYISKQGKFAIDKSVGIYKDLELNLGLHKIETYLNFKSSCEQRRSALQATLSRLKSQGKTLVGYAATSKSTTILNYCNIGTNFLNYICDTTPIKHNKFSPGMHIPIQPYEEFCSRYPDYALLLAWNHQKEIFAKETKFTDANGRWILFVPEVQIISKPVPY